MHHIEVILLQQTFVLLRICESHLEEKEERVFESYNSEQMNTVLFLIYLWKLLQPVAKFLLFGGEFWWRRTCVRRLRGWCGYRRHLEAMTSALRHRFDKGNETWNFCSSSLLLLIFSSAVLLASSSCASFSSHSRLLIFIFLYTGW